MTTDDISTKCSHVHPVEIGTTTAAIFVIMTIMILCLVAALVMIVLLAVHRIKRLVHE